MKLVSLLCAGALTLTAPRAKKRPSYAEQGEAAHEAGDLDVAATAFELAYAEDPKLDYLFAWAQMERFRDRCDVAVDLYDMFLAEAASDPEIDDNQRAKVAEAREQCAAALEAARPPPPTPVLSTPEPLSDEVQQPTQHRWYQDPAGGILVGVGTALVIAGAVIRGTAVARSENARIAATEGSFETDHAGARTLGTRGTIVLSIGATSIVAGVIRWALVARKTSAQ